MEPIPESSTTSRTGTRDPGVFLQLEKVLLEAQEAGDSMRVQDQVPQEPLPQGGGDVAVEVEVAPAPMPPAPVVGNSRIGRLAAGIGGSARKMAEFIGSLKKMKLFAMLALICIVAFVLVPMMTRKRCFAKIPTGRCTKTTKYLGNWITYTEACDEYNCISISGPWILKFSRESEVSAKCSGWSFGGVKC